ncbi:MAG: hypothetical protein NT066_06905, partial [Candidatus Omnitrophica bacterium]|nr:hypothetical protein [Candidatus Omnitrophota bacterium]
NVSPGSTKFTADLTHYKAGTPQEGAIDIQQGAVQIELPLTMSKDMPYLHFEPSSLHNAPGARFTSLQNKDVIKKVEGASYIGYERTRDGYNVTYFDANSKKIEQDASGREIEVKISNTEFKDFKRNSISLYMGEGKYNIAANALGTVTENGIDWDYVKGENGLQLMPLMTTYQPQEFKANLNGDTNTPVSGKGHFFQTLGPKYERDAQGQVLKNRDKTPKVIAGKLDFTQQAPMLLLTEDARIEQGRGKWSTNTAWASLVPGKFDAATGVGLLVTIGKDESFRAPANEAIDPRIIREGSSNKYEIAGLSDIAMFTTVKFHQDKWNALKEKMGARARDINTNRLNELGGEIYQQAKIANAKGVSEEDRGEALAFIRDYKRQIEKELGVDLEKSGILEVGNSYYAAFSNGDKP